MRLAAAALFGALGIFSGVLSFQNAAWADVAVVAKRLERQEPASRESLAPLVSGPAFEMVFSTCRSGLLRAALTLQLSWLDQQDQALEYEGWYEAFSRAERFIAHAMRCMPSDGNLWLRNAMVSRAIAEQPLLLAAKLEHSFELSPAERTVLVARLSVWEQVSDATRLAAEPALLGDILTLLAHGDPRDVQRFLSDPPASLSPFIEAAMGQLPREKRPAEY